MNDLQTNSTIIALLSARLSRPEMYARSPMTFEALMLGATTMVFHILARRNVAKTVFQQWKKERRECQQNPLRLLCEIPEKYDILSCPGKPSQIKTAYAQSYAGLSMLFVEYKSVVDRCSIIPPQIGVASKAESGIIDALTHPCDDRLPENLPAFYEHYVAGMLGIYVQYFSEDYPLFNYGKYLSCLRGRSTPHSDYSFADARTFLPRNNTIKRLSFKKVRESFSRIIDT